MSTRNLRIGISASVVRSVLVTVAALNLFFLLAAYVGRSITDMHWRISFLRDQFNIVRENSVAAWYSSMLLVMVAIAMLLCYVVDRRADRSASDQWQASRALTFGWLLLSILFLLLSWDELGSLHERLEQLPLIATVLPKFADLRGWVALLVLPIGAVAILMLAFGWARVREDRTAFLCMIGGVLLFLSVPLQEHIEVSLRSASGLGRDWSRPAIQGVLEEGAEIFGSFLFLASGLAYLRMRMQGTKRIHAHNDRLSLAVGEQHVAILCVGLAAGLLGVFVFLPHLMYLEGDRGVPQNWYPSVLAAVSALACTLSARQHKSPQAAGLLTSAAICLLLSVDHGTDYVWREEWFASGRFLSEPFGSSGAALARRAAAVAVLGGATLFLLTRITAIRARIGLALWAVLLLPTVAGVHPGTRTVLSFLAYTALLWGVLYTLPAASPTPAGVQSKTDHDSLRDSVPGA